MRMKPVEISESAEVHEAGHQAGPGSFLDEL